MLQAADKRKVTKSINELGRRVTAADVSTKTGLPVLIVSQALNQIASETSGRMAVSQNGDVVYTFSLGFANFYLAKGLARIIEMLGEQIVKVVYFVVKISFGVVLMVSFFINLFLFFLLLNAQTGQRGGRRGAGTPGIARRVPKDLLSFVILRELFYTITSMHRLPIKYDFNQPSTRPRARANFLLDCFSFLFGDGDPNEGLSEKRWRLIAAVIKQHDNVITSEQLAPYTGANPKDEDAVLPVLARFNGKPEVTDSGNIIYTFPSLAVTVNQEHSEFIPPFLQEFFWKFTEIDQSALQPIYLIGTLNFLGSWLFYLLLAQKNAPSLSALLTTLVVYGTLFVVIPIVRHFVLEVLNRRIEQRNVQRAEFAEALGQPSDELKNKIAESREYRLRDERIAAGSIVYTTEKASLEQDGELAARFNPGDIIDAKPDETFDASPVSDN